MKLAMELDYNSVQHRGATKGLEEDEGNLRLSTPIAGLSTYCDLRAVADDFMQTAVEADLKLDNAKRNHSHTRPRDT
jgi:hypothetical protein